MKEMENERINSNRNETRAGRKGTEIEYEIQRKNDN